MKCPICSKELSPTLAEEVMIDICPVCYGIWFDDKELAPVIKHIAKKPSVSSQPLTLFKPLIISSIYKLSENQVSCPKCLIKMNKFNYAYDSNIFLDKCPSCLGIWAEGGEIKKLAEYTKTNPVAEEIAAGLIKDDKTFKAFLNPRNSHRNSVFFDINLLPLHDENLSEKRPYATIALIGIMCLSYLSGILLGNRDQQMILSFGFDPNNFWRIGTFTAIFLHQNFFHFLGNIFLLWLFGDNIEEQLGSLKFIGFFILSGLAGFVAFTILEPAITFPLVGASGAIAGTMGAYFVFFPKSNIRVFFINNFYLIPTWLFFLGFFIIPNTQSLFMQNIRKVEDLAGFLFGMLVVVIYKKFFRTN